MTARKHGRVLIDLAVIFVFAIGAFAAIAYFKIPAYLFHFLNVRDEGLVDQLFDAFSLTGVVLVLAFGVFSLRRWRELRRELAERMQATEALRNSEQRYRELVENAKEIIYTHDLAGRFTSINKAGELVTGYTFGKDLVNILDLIAPEYRDDARRQMIEKVATGEDGLFTIEEIEIIAKDKRRITVEVSNRLTFKDGVPSGVQGTARDITERKWTDAALKEADQRAIREYELLLKRVAALALTLGKANDLTTVFRALRDFASVSTSMTGFLVSLYDPELNVRNFAYVWSDGEEVDLETLPPMKMTSSPQSRAVSTGQIIITDDFQSAIKGLPMVNVKLDVDPRLPQSSLAVPMSVMGKIVGAVEVQSLERAAFRSRHATALQMAANLTANAIENVRLFESERSQAEQLRQSQRLESVGMLAGGIAHDFNNLLTVITGYSELTLRRLDQADPLAQNVNEIKKAADRAAALTRQLLAFSRKQVLQPKVLDLNTVVLNLEKMLGRLIGENLELCFSTDFDLGHVRADPGQIEQIILNLVVNARDAMPQGGKITLETANRYLDEEFAHHHIAVQTGWYAMLAVTDTGIGMDGETQKQIFEPFFTTKEPGKGTGLGLSTVYGIVKQSGGNIWVYSEPGRGTTFKVYFPLVDGQVTELHEGAARIVKATGSATILLAEDDGMVRNLASECLTMQGYTVLVAANAAEALLLGQQHGGTIQLLLTDVVMPGVSGRELADQLVGMRPGLRVLFMSGYADQSIVHHGILDPDVAFIGKPFTPDGLVLKVAEVLQAVST